jgi:hypothetical protein
MAFEHKHSVLAQPSAVVTRRRANGDFPRVSPWDRVVLSIALENIEVYRKVVTEASNRASSVPQDGRTRKT